MELNRYFIQLSYKGTDFFGWQIQPNAISVQESINNALTKINSGIPIKTMGCGRTDTGVHASNFYAHFDTKNDLNTEEITFKLNCMLHKDIAVHRLFKVPNDLHARFSATSRTYHYHIHTAKNAFINETSWHLNRPIDIVLMNNAAKNLIGSHDFRSFSKKMTNINSFTCTVTKAEWTITETGYQFTISANRFLRNMVRAIVGTLVQLGEGKLTHQEFLEILSAHKREAAGISAPAHGLFLAAILYENDIPYFE